VVEEICYSGKMAGHIEKSINCMTPMGGGCSHWIWIHTFFFWHMCFAGGVVICYGHHAFWVNMVSKVSASQQVYISVHQAHDNIA
jgi:hypothetical protein